MDLFSIQQLYKVWYISLDTSVNVVYFSGHSNFNLSNNQAGYGFPRKIIFDKNDKILLFYFSIIVLEKEKLQSQKESDWSLIRFTGQFRVIRIEIL